MCGRYTLEVPWKEIYKWYDLIRPETLDPEMPPRYNIAPTQPIMVVRQAEDGEREGLLVRWGFVPSWVKDPKGFTLIINARSETAAEKPSFRTAIRRRRILIPASGFYEWQRFGKGEPSQPYHVKPADGGIVSFGGLMETWAGADGSEVDTACIITTAANEGFSKIHHRLPLVLSPQDFERWLNCRDFALEDVVDVMKPANENFFDAIPVGNAVNKVANANPSIQERVEPQPRRKDANSEDDDQLSMF